MSKLEAALAWAARGFRVFPVNPETRGGPGEFPYGAGWTDYATTDPAQIRLWWSDPFVPGGSRDLNIACETDDLVVVDVDVKNGKPGLVALVEAGLDLQTTLTVKTTTGGYHLYFRPLADPTGNGALDPRGLDIRSWHGYVLAPGSTLQGVAYSVFNDLPLAEVPAEIKPLLRAPKERAKANGHWHYNDSEDAIALAVEYLKLAEPAIEGVHGDDQTYKVACRLRDFGLSPETAFDLLADHWNYRCSPPWPLDELEKKTLNAYEYATGSVGQATPAFQLGSVNVPEPPPVVPAIPVEAFQPKPAQIGGKIIPPRPWVYHRLLIRRLVTTLIGAGSAGKSTMILTIAAHLALGLDFLGFRCAAGPSKSLIFNAEDDRDEMDRRLVAICTAYELPYEDVSRNLTLLSGDDLMLLLTKGKPIEVNVEHIEPLIEAAARDNVALIGLDPLAEVHTANESDNMEMKIVLAIARMIARRANASVLLGHHSSKVGNLQGIAGDPDAARGATAIINSSRASFTLTTMSIQDCERYGVSAEDRTSFVRLDDAKMNLTLSSGKAQWMRRQGIRIANGDEVGTLIPTNMQENVNGAALLMARAIADAMGGKNTAILTLNDAITALQNNDPLHAQMPAAVVKKRIENFLAAGVIIEGGARVGLLREDRAGKRYVSVVMQ